MSIIDCHVHFTEPESEKRILTILEKTDLEKMNLLSTIDMMRINYNPELIYMKMRHPDTFYTFGALDYAPRLYAGTNLDVRKIRRPSLVQQANTLIEIGFDGVKMIEGHARWRKHVGPLNNRRYIEYFRCMESLQVPILFHAHATALSLHHYDTEPKRYDAQQYPLWVREAGWYHPLLRKARLEVADVLKECPELTVIFAHFGGLSQFPDQAAEVLDNFPNIYLDVTPGMMMYNWTERRDEWRSFFSKYQNRILFGSDVFSNRSVDVNIDLIHRIRRFLETEDPVTWGFIPKKEPTIGFNLPRPVLRKIYATNFQLLVGTRPRSLNYEAALELCQRMGTLMRRAGPWPYRVKNTAQYVAELLRKH